MEKLGAKAVGKLGGPVTTVVIGSVDVIDAYRNGTTGDVVVQTAGIGGAVGGGIIGGFVAGGTAGLVTANPLTIGLSAIIGGVAGAYYGEDKVQWAVDRIVNGTPTPTGPLVSNATPSYPWMGGLASPLGLTKSTESMEIAPYKDVSYAVDKVSWTDSATGESIAVHSVVSLNNSANAPTGKRYDGLRGSVYSPDNINVGRELNALDQIAREQKLGLLGGASSNQISSSSGSGNDNSWRGGEPDRYGSGGGASSTTGQGSGERGTEPNYSLASPTGYSDRGVNDVEGPEAAVGAGAAGGAQNSGGLGMGIGPNGITPSLPVILDLNGNGVEVNAPAQVSFGWNGDGFRVVEPGAANLPAPPRRAAA